LLPSRGHARDTPCVSHAARKNRPEGRFFLAACGWQRQPAAELTGLRPKPEQQPKRLRPKRQQRPKQQHPYPMQQLRSKQPHPYPTQQQPAPKQPTYR
jgi:hypothetical protein